MKDHEKFREIKNKYDKHFSDKPGGNQLCQKRKNKKNKKRKKY